MGKTSRFPQEVKDRAVRLVQEQAKEHPTQWAAIRSIAEKIGCSAETLRNWIRQKERESGVQAGVTTEERQRLKELEKEVQELKRANEILRLASAYLARAKHDRR